MSSDHDGILQWTDPEPLLDGRSDFDQFAHSIETTVCALGASRSRISKEDMLPCGANCKVSKSALAPGRKQSGERGTDLESLVSCRPPLRQRLDDLDRLKAVQLLEHLLTTGARARAHMLQPLRRRGRQRPAREGGTVGDRPERLKDSDGIAEALETGRARLERERKQSESTDAQGVTAEAPTDHEPISCGLGVRRLLLGAEHV